MDLNLSSAFCLPGSGHCILVMNCTLLPWYQRQHKKKSWFVPTAWNLYWINVNAVDINTDYYYPIYFKALKLIREQLENNFVLKARQSICDKW